MVIKLTMKIKNWIKNYFMEIVRVKTSPESIAAGFALGTFISILPTPGFNILLGILTLFLFRKVNKFSLFGSMALWNPFLMIPLYPMIYLIGDLILGDLPVFEFRFVLLETIYNFTVRYLVGSFVVAILFALIGYIVVYYIVKMYQENAKAKK